MSEPQREPAAGGEPVATDEETAVTTQEPEGPTAQHEGPTEQHDGPTEQPTEQPVEQHDGPTEQPTEQPVEDYAADAPEPQVPVGATGPAGDGAAAPAGQPVDDLPYSEPGGEGAADVAPTDTAEPAVVDGAGVEPQPVELSGPPTQRLAQLGLELPPTPAPLAAYVPAVRTGPYVYTSGQLPLVDGALPTTGVVGDQAVDVTVEEAAGLAQRCALNALAAVASVVDLDSVVRVVKVTGFVASAPGFTSQPAVLNGASELLGQVFGDAGRHARSAVGVAALPLGAPVEVEIVVEVG